MMLSRSCSALMRRGRRLLLVAILVLLLYLCLSYRFESETLYSFPQRHNGASEHAIEPLLRNAYDHWKSIELKQPTNLKAGLDAYRRHRGRHPPPGFEAWYQQALKSRAIIVEEYFDQIYEDLEPFWGMPPSDIRSSISGWEWTLHVRNGTLLTVPQGRARSRVWGRMLESIAPHIPDVDIAINPYDEPRVVAPWAQIRSLMKSADQQRERMMSLSGSEFQQRSPLVLPATTGPSRPFSDWSKAGTVWEALNMGCTTLGHTSSLQESLNPYIRNWTSSKDPCASPHLVQLHGALINPATFSVTSRMMPIFSDAKMVPNNDILLPAPAYNSPAYSGRGWFGSGSTAYDWSRKVSGMIWRGKATGGSGKDKSWLRFHRHRFVSLLNASTATSSLEYANQGGEQSTSNLRCPEQRDGEHNHAPDWLAQRSDVAFTDLLCTQQVGREVCSDMASQYRLAKEVNMRQQYRWKYLPDLDGNGLSGRFRAFLRSNSAPIKATIFKEWHDSRLEPWLHFIPLRVDYRDLQGIMEYFIGTECSRAHDDEGRYIAESGRRT